MTRLSIGVAAAAAAMMLAACAHESSVRAQSAAGVLAFDTLGAQPSADLVVLRVQNDFLTSVRIYAQANEDTTEVATVAPGTSQTVGLGPDFFRYALTTFDIRPVNDTTSTLLGPLNLNRGDRVRIEVAPVLHSSHVYQNGNW